MKKGFFSVLFLVLLINPLFATGKPTLEIKVTKNKAVQGDVEGFFDKVKASCAENSETDTGTRDHPEE